MNRKINGSCREEIEKWLNYIPVDRGSRLLETKPAKLQSSVARGVS